MLGRIAGALGQISEAGGSIVGIRRTEEPAFAVQRTIDGVEVRRYGPRVAAETVVDADEEPARNEGFRRLARYIFGGNRAKTKIAMTAPVAQQQGEKIAMTAPVAAQRGPGDQWVIRFFMPAGQTVDSLPIPDDERVRLVDVPGETVAALRFSGLATPSAVAARTSELLTTLRTHGLTPAMEPVTWFYDPPWTIPFRRRNEIAVSLGSDGRSD